MFKHLTTDHADMPAYQGDLADTLQNLGVLYLTTSRPDDGGKLLERAAELRRRLAEDHPDAPEFQKAVARADLDLANFWQMARNTPKADASYREAIDRLGKLVEQYPRVPDYRHMLAYASKDYGILLWGTDHDAAEKMWTTGVDLLTAAEKRAADRAELPPGVGANLLRTRHPPGVQRPRRGRGEGLEGGAGS